MPKTKTNTVEATVREILLGLAIDAEETSPNDTLESLGLDELDRVEFWMMVEDVYFGGQELPMEEVQELDSLQKIYAYIDRKRGYGKEGQ